MNELGLDGWWDDPEYKQCYTANLRVEFVFTKLMQRDTEKFRTVMADLYRKKGPMPEHMTAFEWQTILACMGANPAEIGVVLTRMGLSGDRSA